MVNETVNVKITIYMKNKGNLIANANIIINTVDFGKITIKNFQIWQSRIFNERLGDTINIVPTSITKYPQIFFEQKEKWYILEKMIFEEFMRSKESYIDNDLIDQAITNSN